MREVKFSEVLKQYKIYHFVEDGTEYRQVTISIHSGVSFRGTKFGRDIGRKRQFVIDLEEYPNTFIFTRQGVQNGSYGIAPREVHGCVVTENMPMFSIEPTLNPGYLEYYLQTNHFQDQLQALNASGSAQKSIHEKVLLQLNILLPEIEEQKSIVDEIKSVENKQSKVLEELQTQSKLINKLRSSILSDAVSGKLVPQDPNDESAEVLLEKIKAEKEKLIKEGKIKKQKPLPPISEDEIPYELPDGWVWCKFEEVANLITDGTHQTPTYTDNGKLFVSAKNVNPFQFMPKYNAKYVSENDYEAYIKDRKAEFKDILLTRVGSNIGQAAVIDQNIDFAIYVSVALIKLNHKYLSSEYFAIWLNSPIGTQSSISNILGRGVSQGNLNLNFIRSFLVPLAPLEEQKRIVEKVEKLMASCDALELEVQNSKIETEKLMQSVLKEAFL
ncbi:restriction endonuclease subunit S [Sulfurimonas crateris]|uniref:Restriction endonuclease subunit S n=1 Tax=Sulfurimonas crateris TaxID=2574727 RepID=A0A4U2ZC27_9BACT|nr:restriction endonuclease subunit S [Sulfurimonas crateris]TKI71252.1 restriction endonuclease subunit S [Sulfurimonas crateris]